METPVGQAGSTAVRLLDLGNAFMSRSEAKRLMRGLERFTDVQLDFTGVEEVGQGFVDEVLRVWRGHRSIPVSRSNLWG